MAERTGRGLAARVTGRLGLPPPDRIRPLTGGLGGRSFRVDAGGRRFVLKQIDPRAARLIAPTLEHALLERLADAGVAPLPVGIDVGAHVIVTEFVDGARPMTAGQVRAPPGIGRIAPLLRRLHGVDFDLPLFAPHVYADAYFESLGGIDALEGAEAALAGELRTLADEYTRRFVPETVCHNDLVAANLLDGQEPKLIDFEYAAKASPVLDLASLAAMNDFDADAESRLIDAYFVSRPPPFSRAEFAKVRRLVSLLAHFWARTYPARAAAGLERYIERPVGTTGMGYD